MAIRGQLASKSVCRGTFLTVGGVWVGLGGSGPFIGSKPPEIGTKMIGL